MRDLNKYWVDGPIICLRTTGDIFFTGEYISIYGDHYYIKAGGRYFKWAGIYYREITDKKDILYYDLCGYEETDLTKDPEAKKAVYVQAYGPIDSFIIHNPNEIFEG
jgi:hypothetical protein